MSFFWMKVFVCWKIITFIIRIFVLILFYTFLLLCSTCSIFIISWILKFCMLIFIIIIFWSDWLIVFLITCLIMTVKQILTTWVFNSRAAAQFVFFIMWFFVSAEFSVSMMFSLISFPINYRTWASHVIVLFSRMRKCMSVNGRIFRLQ